jgi:predicted nucleic-acid-binding Zn-ribbon protein
MRKTGRCPKCGSTSVTVGARLVSFGDVNVQKYKKPKWYQFQGDIYSPIEVYICNECGFLEQYASDPKKFCQL